MKSEWREVRLGDFCQKIGSGATPTGGKESYLASGPFSLIRSQNVHNDRFSYDGLAYISDLQAKKLDIVTVEIDDVLLNITGDSVARVCMVANEVLPARVNQHVAIIRPKVRHLDSFFLRYFLVSPKQQARMLSYASSGATRNALTKGMIENFIVPLPPLPEQKAIARILGSLDDKIELNRRMNATLEQMAQTLFRAWFVDFEPVKAKAAGLQPVGMDAETAALFPSEWESSTRLIPKGWEVVPLNTVYKIYDNLRVPLSRGERDLRRGVYPYSGAADVMDCIDDFLFDGVYLLLGEDGSVLQKDDTPVLQYVWGKFWVNNHAHVMQGAQSISTEHLMLALKERNIAAYVTGAVQLKLNQGNLGRIPFLKPTDQIANAFTKILTPIYNQFRNNVEQSQTLAQLRDALLPRLVSGALRVPEAMCEVEAIL